MQDTLDGRTLKIDCLDKGFVRLVDVMPRLSEDGTADRAVAQAARVSYGGAIKTPKEDTDLIRYLLRHRHTTPLEMVEFKFHCKMPIFVARQWIRHRTASVNEISGRYTELKDEFFVPEEAAVTGQSGSNKQGGNNSPVELAREAVDDFEADSRACFSFYQQLLSWGVRKELARVNLPLSTYTEWYWKIDLHNLLHFLALRCDSHAQLEIRVFADAMLELIRPIVPVCVQAWEDYHPLREAVLLTALEVDALRQSLSQVQAELTDRDAFQSILSANSREREEWRAKAKRIGLVKG